MPDEGIGCGFTEAVRGVLSHHMVIRDGKIANYHPYPPTPWNANPRDVYGTPGPVRGRGAEHADLRGERPENFKGIDIMRTVRSFDPCLPCGVHMYLGDGKDAARSCTRPRSRSPASEPAMTSAAPRTRPPGPPGGRRADRGAARRAASAGRPRWRASGPRSWSGCVIELYGAGLERLAGDRARRAAGSTTSCSTALADDELVASLLVVHGLHPDDVRHPGRRRRWTSVRPYLGSHGGDVELLGVDRRRRRAAAAARQLRRLPVVGGHADAGGRDGDPGRRAGGHRASRWRRPPAPPRGSIPVTALRSRLAARPAPRR